MSAADEHIVLGGFGNMGRALASGWLDQGLGGDRLTVVDPSPEARAEAAAMGLAALAAARDLKTPIDVAVLAVKPAQIDALLEDLPRARLYLSIAAGRPIAAMARRVGAAAAIVRAMPNTPAAIGLGVTGLCASATASSADRALASRLMSAVGAVEWLEREADMDALTAVSGSGPAYVFLLIECLIAAAVDAGLEAGLARRLALATVRGAGVYAAESSEEVSRLRQRVTSPGGTTEAALEVLLQGNALQSLISSAVAAAERRSRELSSEGD